MRAFFSPVQTRIRFYTKYDEEAGIEPWDDPRYYHAIAICIMDDDKTVARHAVEWISDKKPEQADIETAKKLLSEWAKERYGVSV